MTAQTKPARPHIALGTAALAALVEGANADTLREIAAELAHRKRKAARDLLAQVNERLAPKKRAALKAVA